MLAKKKIGSLKKISFENFVIGSQCGGFQFMLILDLWGISFHPAVVVGLGNDLLFNFIVGHCEEGAEQYHVNFSCINMKMLFQKNFYSIVDGLKSSATIIVSESVS